MRTTKRYTNTTFTHRVDHDGGRHRSAKAASSPRVCAGCRALYRNKRWTAGGQGPAPRPLDPAARPAHVLCPACRMGAEGLFSGEVRVSGAFVAEHHAEVETLLKREAERAAEDNPTSRILTLNSPAPDKLCVTTTTEHLAKRLGQALAKAYQGEVHYGFSHGNKFAHVTWSRTS